MFGADPAQLERSETHNKERLVADLWEFCLSGTGLKTCTGVALNCSAGNLIWKDKTKAAECAADDSNP